MIEINENFDRLIDVLKEMGEEAFFNPIKTDIYQEFIKNFPVDELQDLSFDEYCVGKGDKSFCWWLENGLVKALGKFSPGQARGNMLYWDKERSAYYKNRKLSNLSDEEALEYVLNIHAVIAQANINEDFSWIDDEKKLAERMGREVLAMPGPARRLRLLSCYNPEAIIPINSLGHMVILPQNHSN